MADDKPRIRVKAGSAAMSPPSAKSGQPATMRYLRGDRSGLLNMRRAITRDAKLDVIEAADRASALAIDFIHNNGWIAGAVSQIVCDTIGVELRLNCRAMLQKFGYDEDEANQWCRDVEAAWQKWAWNPKECDLGGEMTIAEMCDAVLRSYLAYGEGFGVLDNFNARRRRQYGVSTGVKVSLVAPHRCPRVSREFEGLEAGIFRDNIRRPVRYRFRVREGGFDRDLDIAAKDVIHVMDRGENLNAGRGVSPLAPVLKAAAQSDQLADNTLAVALMQQAFAAVIKSKEMTQNAFEALETLDAEDVPEGYDSREWAALLGGLKADFVEVQAQRFESLKNGSLSLTDPARVAHLGPDEELVMVTASATANNYIPHAKDLRQEMARGLGVTFESFTGDHSSSTYSSVRMGVSSIWPIVGRRRQRVVVPFVQPTYEAWLEEGIYEGRIPFKGGYSAFRRDPQAIFQAEFQGPEKPSADPYKDAMASKILMELGLSSHADEAIARGKNPQELLIAIQREIKTMEAKGIPIPFGRSQGGAGQNGAAVEGRRDPAKVDA